MPKLGLGIGTQKSAYVSSAANEFPSDISGNVLRLESDLGITTVGSDVDVWADQSGNGNDVSAPTASNRPAYGSNQLNGIDLISFGGNAATEYLESASPIFTGTGDYTLIAVYASSNTSTFQYIVAQGGDTIEKEPNDRGVGLSTITGGTFYGFIHDGSTRKVFSTVGSNSVDGNAKIYTRTFDRSANTSPYINGSSLATEDISSVNNSLTGDTNLTIGAYSDGDESNGFFLGDLAAILVYDKVLSDTEREQVEVYLANKYGLAHPQADWVLALDGPDQAAVLASGQTKDDYEAQNANAMVLRLESDSGITLNGSDVDIWADQSFSSNDASAPTASNRPAYGINQLNGIDVLSFDGSSEYLERNNNLVSGSSNRTVFVVSASNDDTSVRKMFSDGDGPTNGREFTITPEYGVRVQGGNKIFSTANTSTAAIFTAKLDGSNATDVVAWKNGAALSESSSTSQPLNTGGNVFYIGAKSNGFTTVHYFDGDIAAILVYNVALSDTERGLVETYLSNKFGITLA